MGYNPNKIDPSILNKPAVEVLASKMGESDQGVPVKAPEGFLTEEKTEVVENKDETAATPSSEEESKVPYSRFKKFHDQAKEAQEEADYWRAEAERIKNERNTPQYNVPHSSVQPQFEGTDWERFKALYAGADEELIKNAYKLELERLAGIEERAAQRALESVQQRQTQEEQRVAFFESQLQENVELASDMLGIDLSANTEARDKLLDIIDDYSPKNRDGSYQAWIPIEKAVEIFNMQNRSNPKKEARNQIAALSAPVSSGDSTTDVKDTGWQRGGGWRANFERRFGKKPN